MENFEKQFSQPKPSEDKKEMPTPKLEIDKQKEDEGYFEIKLSEGYKKSLAKKVVQKKPVKTTQEKSTSKKQVPTIKKPTAKKEVKEAKPTEEEIYKKGQEIIDKSIKNNEAVILDPDELKKIYNDYDPKNHKIYSSVNKKLFEYALQNVKNKTVKFIAGGSGSGKSNFVTGVVAENFDGIILDGTLASYDSFVNKLFLAVKYGKKVKVAGIITNIRRAWNYTKKREKETGRGVPLDIFIDKHIGAVQTMIRIAKENKNVELYLKDTRKIKGKEEAKNARFSRKKDKILAKLEKLNYNKDVIRKKLEYEDIRRKIKIHKRDAGKASRIEMDRGRKERKLKGDKQGISHAETPEKISKLSKGNRANQVENIISLPRKEAIQKLQEAIKENGYIKGGEEVLNKVATPTLNRGIGLEVFKRKPSILNLVKENVFTDSFILINDKEIAKKLYKEVKDKTGVEEDKSEPAIDRKQVVPEKWGKNEADIIGYENLRKDRFNQFELMVRLTDGETNAYVDANKLAFMKKQIPSAKIYLSGQNTPKLAKIIKELQSKKPQWFQGRELPNLVAPIGEGVGMAAEPSEFQKQKFGERGKSFNSIRALFMKEVWRDTTKDILLANKDTKPRRGRTFQQIFNDQFKLSLDYLKLDNETINRYIDQVWQAGLDAEKLSQEIKAKVSGNLESALLRTMQDVVPNITPDSLATWIDKRVQEKATQYGINPKNIALNK